jgi:hypothetical protein
MAATPAATAPAASSVLADAAMNFFTVITPG